MVGRNNDFIVGVSEEGEEEEEVGEGRNGVEGSGEEE